MKHRLILAAMILTLFLTGCSKNRHELNTLGVASALSIDKKGDNYVVATQLINPDALRGKGTDPVVSTYLGEGNTISTAIKKIEYLLPRYLFLPDLRLVVISEDIGKNDFNRVIDYMLRNPRFRSDFIFVVSKGQPASETLNQLTSTEKIPANTVYEILTNYAGGRYIFRDRTLNAIARDMEVKDIFLPGLKVFKQESNQQPVENNQQQEDNNEQPLVTAGLDPTDNAIFSNNQFVGWTGNKENRAILFLLSPKSTHNLLVANKVCKDDINVVIKETNAKIKGDYKNGKPTIQIHLDVKSYIGDTSCRISDAQTVDSIEKQIAAQIKVNVEDGVNSILKNYRSDIFGFGWILARKNPREWKKIESNWRNSLADLDVNVRVDAVLNGTGQILNPVPYR